MTDAESIWAQASKDVLDEILKHPDLQHGLEYTLGWENLKTMVWVQIDSPKPSYCFLDLEVADDKVSLKTGSLYPKSKAFTVLKKIAKEIGTKYGIGDA